MIATARRSWPPAILACLLACILAVGLSARDARAAPEPSGSGCRPMAHEGASFVVCRFDLRAYDLRLFLNDPDGEPYGTLQTLLRSPVGPRIAMAMNAGMYDHEQMPVGLYVADGREVRPVNRAAGPGNFHMKPNGVFFVADGRAAILETGAYLKRRARPTLATQSGPMLVIDGRLHPQFSDEGPSRKVRNGVGVVDPLTVVFAISNEPVSFGAFARLFRDELGCRNALFLDGSVSALHAPDLGRTDLSLKPLGPIIAALPRRPEDGPSTRP